MALNERRLTGRDVLAKTFQARTKRGYDPVEVDAYLELMAAQIDMLHNDVANAAAAPTGMTDPGIDVDALIAERDAYLQDRNQFAKDNGDLLAAYEALEAENDQLRSQVTSVAPPPPPGFEAVVAPDVTETRLVEAPVDEAPVVEDPVAESPAPANPVAEQAEDDERAAEESYELVMRMAHRSAEETIAEAHNRADEIIADANFNAAQISRESDRKAFEAANAVQEELAGLQAELESSKTKLVELDSAENEKRATLRALADSILELAATDDSGADVVDLRPTPDPELA
jgi:DivIVA domain-containing protein